MIQTVDQYVFLYRALIEGILTERTSIPVKEFIITRKVPMDIKDQYKVSAKLSPPKKPLLFQLLEQFQADLRFTYHGATEPSNRKKNRFETILAGRVPLLFLTP